MGIPGRHLVDPAPQAVVDDGGVCAGIPAPLVRQFTEVETAAQQLVQVLLVYPRPIARLTILGRPGFGGECPRQSG